MNTIVCRHFGSRKMVPPSWSFFLLTAIMAVSINLTDELVIVDLSESDDGADPAAVAAVEAEAPKEEATEKKPAADAGPPSPKGGSTAERKPADIDKLVTAAESEGPPCLPALHAPQEESKAEQKPADIDKAVTPAEGPSCLPALQAPKGESTAERTPADIGKLGTPAESEGPPPQPALLEYDEAPPPCPSDLCRPPSPEEAEGPPCLPGLQAPKEESKAEQKPADIDKAVTAPAEPEGPPCLPAMQAPQEESKAEQKPADIDKAVTPAEPEGPPPQPALEYDEAQPCPSDLCRPPSPEEAEGPHCFVAPQSPKEESHAEQKPADVASPVTLPEAEGPPCFVEGSPKFPNPTPPANPPPLRPTPPANPPPLRLLESSTHPKVAEAAAYALNEGARKGVNAEEDWMSMKSSECRLQCFRLGYGQEAEDADAEEEWLNEFKLYEEEAEDIGPEVALAHQMPKCPPPVRPCDLVRGMIVPPPAPPYERDDGAVAAADAAKEEATKAVVVMRPPTLPAGLVLRQGVVLNPTKKTITILERVTKKLARKQSRARSDPGGSCGSAETPFMDDKEVTDAVTSFYNEPAEPIRKIITILKPVAKKLAVRKIITIQQSRSSGSAENPFMSGKEAEDAVTSFYNERSRQRMLSQRLKKRQADPAVEVSDDRGQVHNERSKIVERLKKRQAEPAVEVSDDGGQVQPAKIRARGRKGGLNVTRCSRQVPEEKFEDEEEASESTRGEEEAQFRKVVRECPWRLKHKKRPRASFSAQREAA